jgi:hypothetical protein
MFGQSDDNQQTAGSAPTVQNPSMLDNVSTQDLQGQTESSSTLAPAYPDLQPTTAQPVTSDPFGQTPLAPVRPDPLVAQPLQDNTATVAPSEPATAPLFVTSPPAADDNSDTTSSATLADQKKLADMKQDAMTHLGPLFDHIDGTPEETFKTTMMMIQANDNHTLIDKALDAAKNIADDKERAGALLDIINEINYFSQVPAQE